MTRKSLFIFTLIFIIIGAMALAVPMGIQTSSAEGYAAVSWKAYVAYQKDGQYVAISSANDGVIEFTETTSFTLFVSNYSANDNFEYLVTRTKYENTPAALNNSTGWTSFLNADVKSVDLDRDGVAESCYSSNFDSSSDDMIYVYFRRKYTEASSAMVEYYDSFWSVDVNTTLGEADLGIKEVKAQYMNNNVLTDYYGKWIGTGLIFTVTTDYMDKNGIAFNGNYERLSYSVDGKEADDANKRWLPMTSNTVTVKNNMKDGKVDFRLTDVAGKNAKVETFAGVNIDTTVPVFDLSATTIDPNNGQSIVYENRSWTSRDVTFGFSDVSGCISGVTYYYSTDGINYVGIPSLVHVVRNTTQGIRFRAITGAQVAYDFGDAYDVNIDFVQPGIQAVGYTDDPDKEGERKVIPALFSNVSDTYTATADANGVLYLNLYNQDTDGNYITNASGAKFYYAVSVDGGEFGAYKEATNSVVEGNNTYYFVSDSISRGVSSARKYKFYVQSGAGLRSDETYYEVSILNDFFEIEVQDITYTPNASGWAASAIPVYVTVPSDSKIERNYAGEITGYTTPTTKYSFFYSPTNIANLTYEAKGEYHTYVENEEGLSVYVFYLSASAESTFNIYAKNGAGKRSANTYVGTETIKIDVLKPEVETSAYIRPLTEVGNNKLYIKSGDWVNGSIMFSFTVKDCVSGILVKDLNFAVDGEGNPVYNSKGELIWQESTVERTFSDTINNNGTNYFVYNVEISLPDSGVVSMSREYRFRVYTRSGVYTDVEFLANIDTSAITLDEIGYSDSEGEQTVAVSTQRITLPSVCEDAEITLLSNAEQKGHFDYYLYDEDSGEYNLVSGNEMTFSIPADRKGELVKKFYLVSRAKDYKGIGYTTDINTPYEIVIPYNTLNITINYELITDTTGGVDTQWVDSNLTVQIGLVSNDDGEGKELSEAEKRNYSYYYMLIDNVSGLNLNEAIRNGEWLVCSGGAYSVVNGESKYTFEIDFTGDSFYGYIALSVTNEAGFRSSTQGDVNRLLHIDRTTPDLADMIEVKSGTNEKSTIDGITTFTYYSKDSIEIQPKAYLDRSVISYYYVVIDDIDNIPVTENPTAADLKGWTKMNSSIVLNASDGYKDYRYLFYAVNELGSSAGGVEGGKHSTDHRFVIDTAQMQGTLSYDPNKGGYFDDSLKMYAFMWEENAVISVSVTNSNTDVKYYYSLDDGREWHPYLELGGYESFSKPGDVKTLTFNENYFPDGVNSAFTFKAVNKAGTEFVYGTKIYIAIDTMTPEFEVSLTVDGVEYNGGDTVLGTYSKANWSNRPVTIEIIPTKVNVSGVKYTYIIEYSRDNETLTTTERETPSSTVFTTDRLDGFGINRDAVITIRATSRTDNDRYSERKFRVKVDQVTPEFNLTGIASNENSATQRNVVSGEWTNFTQVSLTKQATVDNVSNVTYTYTERNLESTGVTQHDWPSGNPVFTKISTITVTASTDAGLTCVKEFQVNIDTVPPIIRFDNEENISIKEGEKHYIDLRVRVEEENIEICEYITIKGESRGFALDPSGYIISTSSVDNTIRYDNSIEGTEEERAYRGYVKIYVKDYAGNTATFEFYMLPFNLDVNNVTLSDNDRNTIDGYERDLNAAESYMEGARVTYFRNLISRLRDRINTLENEIETYRAYLETLAQQSSFSLEHNYQEMFEYLEQFRNYELYGQKWIQEAITGDRSSIYYTYYEKMLLEFSTLQAKMQEVQDVENAVIILPAINMVEPDDYNDILNVYNNYQDLTQDQTSCFSSNLYTKLLAIKKKCEIMLLADEDTGVSLDADFAPGAKIKVETFATESEYYTNAQTAILNIVKDTNAPRAVISIYRVSLTGASSQTSTGDIVINLPIPEDYRQYVRFAVYEMSADGNISPVSDMEIEGDGKSVTFTSEGLTTYVLTTKANIQVNDVQEDVFGTFLGLPLDVEMIRTLAIIGAVLFVIVIVVVIIAGVRHTRFLNTYNRAYKSGIYRRGIQRIPKGNTVPRRNPSHTEDRVKTQRKPY